MKFNADNKINMTVFDNSKKDPSPAGFQIFNIT